MKIGISGYIGKYKTGIGRTLENVLLELAKVDNNITYYLFINYDQYELIRSAWPTNVKIIKYKVSKNNPIGNILWHQFYFQMKLKQYKCDLSLIPNFSLLLWKSVPTVVVIYDLIEFNVLNKFSKLRVKYRYFSVPLMAKKADKIITISKCSKDDIIKYCRVEESKIVIAYCGYDKNMFRELTENDVYAKIKTYSMEPYSYILYVGTIDYPGKNVFSLIKSFFYLKEKRNIREKLLIAGNSGYNSNIVFDLVRNSPYKNEVFFLGFVKDEDLPFLYSGAKVFCYLSYYEGFGLPVLEAMACGCPVIGSNSSSIPEILDNAGILVDPNNIDEIADAIYGVITSDNLGHSMKKKGLYRAESFSWNNAAARYYEVLKKLNS
jgi:glycosyltransferase involved in cell wall biosynthesis